MVSWNTNLRLLELIVTDLQLHTALAFIVLEPVHELDLLQVLVVHLLPLWGQGLVARRILLQVGHDLVPLLNQTLDVRTFQFQLEQMGQRGEWIPGGSRKRQIMKSFDLLLSCFTANSKCQPVELCWSLSVHGLATPAPWRHAAPLAVHPFCEPALFSHVALTGWQWSAPCSH